MKILFIQEYYYPYIGGVETLFKVLAENLVKRGHTVRVVCTKFNKNFPGEEIINGVEVIRVPIASRYTFSFIGFFFIWKYSKGFDFIQTTTYNAALPAFFIALFRKKKIAITFHELWGKLWFQLPFMNFPVRLGFFLYERFVLHLPFHKFIAVSDSTKNDLLKSKKSSKVVRIYNGIEYNFEISDEKYEQFTFTYFGRLGVSKGLDILLKAAKIFLHEHPETRLQLIIPVLPKATLHTILRLIDEYNIKDKTIVQHDLPRKELFKHVQKSHCVIIPSYKEGFCFTAVETIAMGVPIISSNKGALMEVVSGKHLKMKEHTPECLAENLLKMKNGEWDETPLRKFELQEQVEQYIEVYKEFINV